MPLTGKTTVKEYEFDQSIIGDIVTTRTYTTDLQAGFTPAKYNAVAIDSDDSKLVLYDAADATHSPIGIVYAYSTGNMLVVTEANDVDINKLDIANLAANKLAAATLLKKINITVL